MKKVTIVIVVIAIFLRLFTLLHYYGWVYERPKTSRYPIFAYISKSDYEVTEDDRVLIYCNYYIENSGDYTVSFQLEARFITDHRNFFLKEETFRSDETFTLEPGERARGQIVFEGHRWLRHKMWDRTQPITIVVNSHSEISEPISVEEAAA